MVKYKLLEQYLDGGLTSEEKVCQDIRVTIPENVTVSYYIHHNKTWNIEGMSPQLYGQQYP